MVKSIWVVVVDVYDYSDYYRGLMHQQKLFPSLKEAFAYYKEEKSMTWIGKTTHAKLAFFMFLNSRTKMR